MNTIRKDTGMTGNLQRFIAIFLLAVIAGTHAMPATAHAGFLDWFGGETSSPAPAEHEAYLANSATTPVPEPQSAISGQTLMAIAPAPVTSANKVIRYRMTLQISAYNSEVGQTDDSPFITANGSYVHDGIVATNILPFGTRVKIPALFGEKVFTVTDRMNKRYQNHMDVWMEHKADALRFGRRSAVVEVIH